MRGPLKSTVLCAFIVILLVPTTARANRWLAWLEELSGPGPYDGYLITADVACLGSAPSDTEAGGLAVYSLARLSTRSDAVAVEAFDGVMAELSQPGLMEDDMALLAKVLSGDASTLTPYIKSRPAATAATPVAATDLWQDYQRQQRRFRRCRVDRSNNLLSVQLEVGRYKDDLKGDRYEGSTSLTTISAIAYLPVERLIRWHWTRPLSRAGRFLELGAGVGAYGLRGTTLRDEDLWRGVIPLRLRVIPSELVYALFKDNKGWLDTSLDPATRANRWRRVLQAFEYRIGQDLVLGTLDRDLFGEAGPQTTDQRREWVRSYGLNVDVGIVFRALIGH